MASCESPDAAEHLEASDLRWGVHLWPARSRCSTQGAWSTGNGSQRRSSRRVGGVSEGPFPGVHPLGAQLRVTTFWTFRTEHRHLTATSGLLVPCRPRAGTLRNQVPGETSVLVGSLEHGSSKKPSTLRPSFSKYSPSDRRHRTCSKEGSATFHREGLVEDCSACSYYS